MGFRLLGRIFATKKKLTAFSYRFSNNILMTLTCNELQPMARRSLYLVNKCKVDVVKCLCPIDKPVLFSDYLQVRKNYSKKKKIKNKVEKEAIDDDEDDEDDDDDFAEMEDEYGIKKDYKDVEIKVSSLRIDTVLKVGLGISRRKIEQYLYTNKFRVNGQKFTKKGIEVEVGDELDLIKDVNKLNTELLNISRIVVKSIGRVSPDGKFPLKVRRFKSLIVENYQEQWNPSSDQTEF